MLKGFVFLSFSNQSLKLLSLVVSLHSLYLLCYSGNL